LESALIIDVIQLVLIEPDFTLDLMFVIWGIVDDRIWMGLVGSKK